jgi:hypothetical protein
MPTANAAIAPVGTPTRPRRAPRLARTLTVLALALPAPALATPPHVAADYVFSGAFDIGAPGAWDSAKVAVFTPND